MSRLGASGKFGERLNSQRVQTCLMSMQSGVRAA